MYLSVLYLFIHTLLNLSHTTHLKQAKTDLPDEKFHRATEVWHEFLLQTPRSFPPASKSHTCSHWIFHKGHCHCDSPILDPFSVFMSYLLTMSTPLKLTLPRHAHSSAHTHRIPRCTYAFFLTATKIEPAFTY